MFVRDSAELYLVKLCSADSSAPEGKLNFFLKIRSLILKFAFLSFVDKLGSLKVIKVYTIV